MLLRTLQCSLFRSYLGLSPPLAQSSIGRALGQEDMPNLTLYLPPSTATQIQAPVNSASLAHRQKGYGILAQPGQLLSAFLHVAHLQLRAFLLLFAVSSFTGQSKTKSQ